MKQVGIAHRACDFIFLEKVWPRNSTQQTNSFGTSFAPYLRLHSVGTSDAKDDTGIFRTHFNLLSSFILSDLYIYIYRSIYHTPI